MLSNNKTMYINDVVEKIIDKSNDTECYVNGVVESFFYYI